MIKNFSLLLSLVVIATACKQPENQASHQASFVQKQSNLEGFDKAYFASGCFWCVEAIFESVTGVEEVISGYAGGTKENADYRKVSSGKTRHAESVEVYYNADVVSYDVLLEVFFGSHDPTTLNRQGPDAGPQYRSAIFYQNEKEKMKAEAYVAELTKSNVFNGPITTEISALDVFYAAEDYHQDYEKNHPENPYVQSVSIPRFKRFQEKYPQYLKKAH